MRVTYNYLVDSVLNGFQNNISRLQTLQEKLSLGKNIKIPDQGPIESAKILAFKTKDSQYTQYITNIDESISWLNTTENSMSQINSNVARLRELSINSTNGSLPESATESIISELRQIKNQLISDGNSQVLGKYLFSGLNTLTQPFTESAGSIVYNGDSGIMSREISFNADIAINFSGDKIFNMDGAVNPSDPNIFEIIDNFIADLQAGNISDISNTVLGQVDRATDNIINIYSEIGSRINRLEMTKTQHQNNQLSIQTMLSNIEDIDITEVVMELKKADSIYQASLQVAGKVFPQTLLDYLE